MTTRPAAVAGTFYPGQPGALRASVVSLLETAELADTPAPQALIVPHAGYIYSGPIAASAYRVLEQQRERVKRVVLIGPAHRVYVRGMALPSVDAFATPLGEVLVDREAIEQLAQLPSTAIADDAHALEHCLEVHLPFLQVVLAEFAVVPILVGDCSPADVAQVLESLWNDDTFILVSSDLSHYHRYEVAQRLDAQTTASIVARETNLHGEQACGAHAINGLLQLAKQRDLEVAVLAVRNSGDTAGERDQVVGYGAYALH